MKVAQTVYPLTTTSYLGLNIPLGSERKRFVQAERLFREALARYAETLPADHLYVGIARIKLGRSLLRQGRYRDAEKETLAGYGAVAKQSDANLSWLVNARHDLIDEYTALELPEQAAKYAAEIARLEAAGTGAGTH